MLQTIICAIFIISSLTSFSQAMPPPDDNETNDIQFNSQLFEIRAEQERHVKLIDGLVKDLDIQDRQVKSLDQLIKAMDVQSIRAELEKQEQLINGLVKESDMQLVRADFSSLRAEQERQGKDGVDKDAAIKSIREELERQGNLTNGLVKESDIQLLRTDTQAIKVELERQEKLIDGLVKELDQRYLRYDNCAQAKVSGIYDILIANFSSQTFKVACDAETREGGWTVILSRLDGSVDFYRNWTEYQKGFGDLNGEFFLGLDKIHALTADRKQELLVILEDFEGVEKFETYDDFAIGNEDQLYELHTLGNANGTAGDSLTYHRHKKFSTFDRDNDTARGNCAHDSHGAWWYGVCYYSNLTGKHGSGITWGGFRASLKRAVMLIRPRK